MTHVDVGVEVELRRGCGIDAGHRRHPLHLLAELEHLVPVLHEVQVGPADPARLHTHERLAEPGLGISDVVTDDDLALVQHRCSHHARSLS